MGNENSNSFIGDADDLDGYEQIRKEYEWNSGEVSVYRRNGGGENGEHLLIKERIFDTEEGASSFKKDIQKVCQINHPNLCRIRRFACR